MWEFIAGLVVGVVALSVWLGTWVNNQASTVSVADEHKLNAAKLKLVRKRLGWITTRDSLAKVRKIAHNTIEDIK